MFVNQIDYKKTKKNRGYKFSGFLSLALFSMLCLFVSSQILSGFRTYAAGISITQEEWDSFEPAFEDFPQSIKAAKELELETNAPEGVEVQYSVSNEKYAKIEEDTFIGKRVGTVKVTAVFNADINGNKVTKELTQKIKIKGKKKIFIDPGHQTGNDLSQEQIGPGSKETKYKATSGCVGAATKIPEYKFTLAYSKKLKKALIEKGYDVEMSRTKNDIKISNIDRAIKGNKSGADICIRIHADSIANSSVRGASVLYPSESNPYPVKKQAKKSKKLANLLIKSYCKATGIKSRGIVVRNDLTGTNWSTIPTVLIECGFMSNPTEDRLLNDSDMQKKMVKGMVDAVDKYFGF